MKGLTNPGENVDFETMWNDLAKSLEEIHTKNASRLSFEELYRNAYKLVLKKKGEALYDHVKEFERVWFNTVIKTRILESLSPCLLVLAGNGVNVATTNERLVAGERFLRSLKQAWEDHNLCMSMTTDVLMYMDRVYCADKRRPSIFTAGMGLFRDCILFSPISEDKTANSLLTILKSVILDQISMDRNGDSINRTLLRSCAYMLEGLYKTDREDENEKLYLLFFESDFLDTTATYYRDIGASMMRDGDAGSYLQFTAKRLKDEDDRCRSSISPLSEIKLRKVVEHHLIRLNIQEVLQMEGSGIKFMIQNDRFEELSLAYDLVSRVDVDFQELKTALAKEVSASGQAINNEGNPDPTVSSPPSAAALLWVERLLKMKDKFDIMWTRSFSSHHGIQTAIERAFSQVINTFNRNTEYLSLFIDDHLKRGLKGKTDDEVDVVLDKAITLLRYIQDKDMFEGYYKKHLSRRLLLGRSLSEEVERQMITKMKMAVGNTFTAKLEGMFKDMNTSRELVDGYRNIHNNDDRPEDSKIDLAPNILTMTFWPTDAMSLPRTEPLPLNNSSVYQAPCEFPAELTALMASFESFYNSKHNGRKLTWMANLGSADIRATFPKLPGNETGRERKYEINVSTYAMVILLLFNSVSKGDSLTFQEIQARTLIPPNELSRNLLSLAVAPKTRVLLKEPMNKDIKPTDKFLFNELFTSKFVKIKIGVVAGGSRVEDPKQRKETEDKANETRMNMIEAAIVRIMKQRKELDHSQLLSEVISLLSGRFKPDISQVKKRIESLIEREYLERMEDVSRPAYRYLA
ncbi:MAG: Cullin-3 [Trizodia sp. TS-e1964]|nr:MAG: Cullin-3 [Trizodia sp. TS-e1964]